MGKGKRMSFPSGSCHHGQRCHSTTSLNLLEEIPPATVTLLFLDTLLGNTEVVMCHWLMPPPKHPVCDRPWAAPRSVGTALSGCSRGIRVGHCVTQAVTWEHHPCQLSDRHYLLMGRGCLEHEYSKIFSRKSRRCPSPPC